MVIFRNILLTLILLSILNSCTPSESYLMNIQSNLRMIERVDHQKCIAKGIEFEEWSDVSTSLYWRCRYILSQSRFIQSATTSSDIKNNAMVKKSSTKILKNLKRSQQAVLSKIEENIEVFDHSKCVSLGFDLDSDDQNASDAYYRCRKKLIYERTPPSPAITNSYEASIVGNQKQFDQYLQNARSNKLPQGGVKLAINNVSQYSNCQNINANSKFFWDCVDAQKESEFCLSNIGNMKAKKQLDDKIYCQSQAEVQFPDNYMVAKNKSPKEIESSVRNKANQERKKKRTEQEVNRTKEFFESGNISKDITLAIDNTQKNQVKKEELFNKVQILRLREEFINKCNDLMDLKLPDYLKTQKDQCLSIGINWRQNIPYNY